MADPRYQLPADPAAARARWQRASRERPARIEPVGPGEESVWDFPRPPRVEPLGRRVRVELAGVEVAASDRALRVCETASPPTVYLPFADVDRALLEPASRRSFCEWKGAARYWHVRAGGERALHAAWSYPEPEPGFEALRDHVAFYPSRLACFVDGERVRPQPGDFYGGWITPGLRGPFKGTPGTEGW